MLAISLIVIGGTILFSGIVLLVKNPKSKPESLSQAITLVKADGVFTPKEEILIREIAKNEGRDPEKEISQIRKDLTEFEGESETAMIDINQKAGLDFEKFVIQKFDEQYFRIRNWAGDKFVNGRYAETTTQPDIQLSLNLGRNSYPLAVECKWRKQSEGDFIRFANEGQIERYKKFSGEENYPVFIVLGVGGKPTNPDELYVIPVTVLNKPVLHKSGLWKYRKKVDTDFFFDQESGILS